MVSREIMIGIIDYGAGNLQSVRNAIYNIGYTGTLINNPQDIHNCIGLILPGVGSFSDAMSALNGKEWIEQIYRHLDKRRKLMGICLGMQLLFERGTEGGLTQGLRLIEGSVEKFNLIDHRVPHVGWNSVSWKNQVKHPCIEKIKTGIDFYHVHSYICKPEKKEVILGTCEYGSEFVTAVACGDIVGFQFHPEKSQPAGQKIIENFCEWCSC